VRARFNFYELITFSSKSVGRRACDACAHAPRTDRRVDASVMNQTAPTNAACVCVCVCVCVRSAERVQFTDAKYVVSPS